MRNNFDPFGEPKTTYEAEINSYQYVMQGERIAIKLAEAYAISKKSFDLMYSILTAEQYMFLQVFLHKENLKLDAYISEWILRKEKNILLDLIAHFGGWETPIMMSNEDVQKEITKFMEEIS